MIPVPDEIKASLHSLTHHFHNNTLGNNFAQGKGSTRASDTEFTPTLLKTQLWNIIWPNCSLRQLPFASSTESNNSNSSHPSSSSSLWAPWKGPSPHPPTNPQNPKAQDLIPISPNWQHQWQCFVDRKRNSFRRKKISCSLIPQPLPTQTMGNVLIPCMWVMLSSTWLSHTHTGSTQGSLLPSPLSCDQILSSGGSAGRTSLPSPVSAPPKH